jgi:hypothetical protein
MPPFHFQGTKNRSPALSQADLLDSSCSSRNLPRGEPGKKKIDRNKA